MSESMQTKGRLAARFDVEGVDEGVKDTLEAMLFALGSEGTWEPGTKVGAPGWSELTGTSGRTQIHAYFADHDWNPQLTARCARLGDDLGCAFDGFELIIDQDWMAGHRSFAQPVLIGRFLVDPSEPDDAADGTSAQDSDATRIRVPARRAFGTGSHETTRLVLRQMQEMQSVGSRVLDVGCGTGVLSFAAHHLGAESVVGYDIDPVSAVLAVDNRVLNRLPGSVQFLAGTEACLDPDQQFDTALVNVLPEKIRGYEADIARLLAGDGAVLLSGLLLEHVSTQEALARWQESGWVEVDRMVEGEWLAVRLQRAGGKA